MPKILKDKAGHPLCPYCKKPTKRKAGIGTVTAMYFEPIYDEEGRNINPDRNWHTTPWYCMKCSGSYIYRSNGEEETIQLAGG